MYILAAKFQIETNDSNIASLIKIYTTLSLVIIAGTVFLPLSTHVQIISSVRFKGIVDYAMCLQDSRYYIYYTLGKMYRTN